MKKSKLVSHSKIGSVQSTKVICIKTSHFEPVFHSFIVYFESFQSLLNYIRKSIGLRKLFLNMNCTFHREAHIAKISG